MTPAILSQKPGGAPANARPGAVFLKKGPVVDLLSKDGGKEALALSRLLTFFDSKNGDRKGKEEIADGIEKMGQVFELKPHELREIAKEACRVKALANKYRDVGQILVAFSIRADEIFFKAPGAP
jgi:hypothetical protein